MLYRLSAADRVPMLQFPYDYSGGLSMHGIYSAHTTRHENTAAVQRSY